MKKLMVFLLAGGLMALGSAHAAGNPAAGKKKSTTCQACHGAKGKSTAPKFPNLAGQHADYLYQALKEYKSGKRKSAIMSGQASGLSDQDMQDLAAYFASLKGGVYNINALHDSRMPQ